MDESIIEKDSFVSRFSSIHLDLPVSDDSSSSSSSGKKANKGQNLTQEKHNFSLVLMETIVDTLLKVAKSKIQLAKIRAIIAWRSSRYDVRLIHWMKFKEGFAKLNKLGNYIRKKQSQKKFFTWNEKVAVIAMKKSFDKDLNEIKEKYKTKLLLMSQEINSLNEKQILLEKSSADYMNKEKNGKEASKVFEESDELKESNSELNYLQNENMRLRAKLQSKENKLIAYFESLAVIIDNAPVGGQK